MERKIKMAYRPATREFFVHVYCADGSFCEYGPFVNGEDAAEQIHHIEHPTYEANED